MNIANKAINLVFILLLIIVLPACKETEQAEVNTKKKDEQTAENLALENEPSKGDPNTENNLQDITYSFTNPKTGQEFAILHAYKLYDDYFKALEEFPDESPHQLFRQVISDPIYDACFKSESYSFSVFEWVPEESKYESIRKQIEVLDQKHLNKLFEESLIKSSDILPSEEKTTVCVFPQDERFPSDMMLLGVGKIVVLLLGSDNDYYPRSYYYSSYFEDYSRWGLSHEYHHSVWTEKHYTDEYFPTLLDSIIMEGQAVMFETFVYPKVNSAASIVDESYNKDYWNTIETYLESGRSNDIIHGGYKDLPPNYGYSEGYKIIRSYLELHPDMTVEEWTSKSPKEIFEESNYISNYE